MIIVSLHCFTATHTLPADSKTPFSRSVARQEMAERKLCSQFKTVFNASMTESKKSERYLIYKCDDLCISEHRYFHGITSGFLLASMMKRRFKMADTGGASVFDSLETGVYDWKTMNLSNFVGKVVRPVIAEVSPEYRETEVFSLARDMMIMDFDLEFPEQLLYLTGNYDFIRDLRRNPIVTEQFSWLGSIINNDFIRLVHTGLVKIPNEMKQCLRQTLSEQLGNNKLFCYYGNDQFSIGIAASVLKLVEKYGKEYKVFIHATDTEKFLLQNDLSERVISLDNLKSRDSNVGNASFDFIISLEIGTLCDIMVTTNNPSGVLAAILRPTTKDLYCVGHQEILYSCTREGITGAFRDGISFIPSQNYLRKKYRHKRTSLIRFQ